jgi:hypothetical protein
MALREIRVCKMCGQELSQARFGLGVCANCISAPEKVRTIPSPGYSTNGDSTPEGR